MRKTTQQNAARGKQNREIRKQVFGGKSPNKNNCKNLNPREALNSKCLDAKQRKTSSLALHHLHSVSYCLLLWALRFTNGAHAERRVNDRVVFVGK